MSVSRRIAVALMLAFMILPVPSPLRGGLGRGESRVHAANALLPTSLGQEQGNGAVCRIHNFLPNGTANVGSGTLIDVASSGERGLVLTCGHLFTEGAGRVVVEFPGGQTHGAILIAVDHNADLAALEIARPSARPTAVATQLDSSSALRACGFGGAGQFKCAQGNVLGYSESPGRVSLRMAGAVRSGDSGAGVFDSQGRLCAVVWGESGGVTYASTGRPLAAFLQRVLGSRRGAVSSQPLGLVQACPDGRCPLVGPGSISAAPAGRSPAASERPPLAGLAPAARSCDCEDKLAAIAARLDALQIASNATPDNPSSASVASAARSATAITMTALGISGPMGWGMLGAATVCGWLIGRRLKRRRRRQSSSNQHQASSIPTSSEATAAADSAFPIERDDREARELLRLSQLEGRDPLQDALAGRLALDRLDSIAEGDADPNHATWADRLRRELREKFNEIAPTKFQLDK
jgi:hypothetical protein